MVARHRPAAASWVHRLNSLRRSSSRIVRLLADKPGATSAASGSDVLAIETPLRVDSPDSKTWDHECDVLVVGFGAAGACAAIEAARNGAAVTIVDRFGGGG